MGDKKFWRGFIAGIFAMACLTFGLVIGMISAGKIDPANLLYGNSSRLFNQKIDKKVQEIEGYIGRYYLDKIDEKQVEDSVCSGLLNGLGDNYAAYYNKDAYTELTEKTAGKYCGIGAYVGQNATTGAITIVQPIKDGPADKAGLKAGDIIYSINGKQVTGKDITSAISIMKGKPGTKVTLQIIRKGQKDYLSVTLIRKNLTSDTVSYQLLDGNIGYIRVTSFESVTTKQFSNALAQLEKRGQKGLIIDLRNNGGGLLSTAVDMLDRMLPKKLLVYTKDKYGKSDEYYSTNKESFEKPVAILVNGNTASASEVFSGALQDYKKAVLVGSQTFGKGIVQSIFNLSDGTAVKMTTSKYYTPKGRNIHGEGLKPDFVVKQDDVTASSLKLNLQQDKQLQKAIEYISKY